MRWLFFFVVAAIFTFGQTPRGSVAAPAPPTKHDGRRDFDYQYGAWRVHVKRMLHPRDRSSIWVTYAGTHTVTPIWGGRANIGVLEIAGPEGKIEGLQLRLYNPATRRWKLTFASSRDGELQPPLVGQFRDRKGEFFDSEPVDGRMALVRSVSIELSPRAYRDVISYSDDNGKTWAAMWIADYAKV